MSPENPATGEEIAEIVRTRAAVLPCGGGSKQALLSAPEGTTFIDTRAMSGIVEYLPSEYTLTVRSGTRLKEINAALSEHGQYLPFDPPLVRTGATIGGTVAAGLSGPGAYRFGPLKDFIIGVRFVDGLGNLVRGGGKVVKNAAGFDFPKLFNGSLGRLGIITELSFKVFPEPSRYVTLEAAYEDFEKGVAILPKLKGFDLDGVELNSTGFLSLRLRYQEATMDARQKGLETLAGKTMKRILGDEEPERWKAFKAFGWSEAEKSLFKVATTPDAAVRLKRDLEAGCSFHLSNGGKAFYLEGDPEKLDELLRRHRLTGLQLTGKPKRHPLIGHRPGMNFIDRVQRALDPNHKFLPFTVPSAVPA